MIRKVTDHLYCDVEFIKTCKVGSGGLSDTVFILGERGDLLGIVKYKSNEDALSGLKEIVGTINKILNQKLQVL